MHLLCTWFIIKLLLSRYIWRHILAYLFFLSAQETNAIRDQLTDSLNVCLTH